jgi:hypothetical protein
MWGGLGQFDSPDALQVGPLRLQDVLAVAGIGLAVFPILLRRSWPKPVFLALLGPVAFLVLGSVMGRIEGNDVRNIAIEVRPLVFQIAGIAVGAAIGAAAVKRRLYLHGSILAAAFVVQFVFLALTGGSVIFVSGASTGNPFTLNMPIVRPAGGYHVIAAAFVLVVISGNSIRQRALAVLLALGLVVTQSKTYWIIVMMTIGYLVVSGTDLRQITRRAAWAALAILMLGGAAGGAAALSGGASRLTAPIEKFTMVVQNPLVANVVLSKRTEELGMMRRALHSAPMAWVLGHGLGYIYRDQGALYFREDPRDRQRLAMFGHNYYGWLLVKGGLLNVVLILLPAAMLIRRGWRGSPLERGLAASMLALLVSSMAVGSLENVPGTLAFGLAMGAIGSSKPRISEMKANG